ncbi:MAG: hydrogenase formation protein HypD [Verrucomicrobia bacterium]|nr:hydrogenase formation protein HypD [Verrucomicrobiota bacterium]
MKYLEGFRNPAVAKVVRHKITELAARLRESNSSANIMEVCGTHTMSIARYGIRSVLPDNVNLISGPGCPVCVTPPGYVDAAIELAQRGNIIVTFGDMLPVPGSETTLASCRAEGARIETCYSPALAIELAQKHPDRQVVFLAIGFETTVPAVISIVDTAIERRIANVSLLTSFKVVPPALAALLGDTEMGIDAFLCPAHVSAIIGSNAYLPFAGSGGVPCVIAGFEPLDILMGLAGILDQLTHGEARVDNQYSRVVKPRGNELALEMMNRFLQPEDALWRGLGIIPSSGLCLRPEFAEYDAARRHGIAVTAGKEPPGCLCGEVIKGKARPEKCRLFGNVCTPDNPVGPCMVSAEGSCAACFKYGT